MDIYTPAFEQGMKMYWISNKRSIPLSGITKRDIEIARKYRKIIEKPYKTPYHYERKLIDRFVQKYYPTVTSAIGVKRNVKNFVEGTVLEPYQKYMMKSAIAKTHETPSQENMGFGLKFYENYRIIKERLRRM